MSVKAKIRSRMMGVLSSAAYANWQRTRARYLRLLRVEGPKVLYFHQIDDPYSHLVVQKLEALQDKYALPFVSYLVGQPEAEFKGDAEKFGTWARTDAASIAPFFAIETGFQHLPTALEVDRANQALVQCSEQMGFAQAALQVGERLWQGQYGTGEHELISNRTRSLISRNNKVRARLGHYLGGTFYFEGEWFWGVDRLHLLETRLQNEGFGQGDLVCPLPKVDDFVTSDFVASNDVVLEYFPSLRSPYTAIGHGRVLDLVARTGVQLKLRPVMPMMMRGVPAPQAKQRYIMMDSGREARFYGDDFGPFCDPLGEPVKRAFAVYHHAAAMGKGLDFVSQYLKAAFAEGLPITMPEGLDEVCRRTGFALDEVDKDADWLSELESNLAVMAEASLWGVPSFRVSSANEPPFACWGQDRIWRVAAEIARRGQK